MFVTTSRGRHPRVLILAILVLSALVTAPSVRAQTSAAGASITVHAVGDRDTATGAPIPLSGATLRAYSDAALTTVVGECVTAAGGSCAIAGLTPGTYWVAPADDPVGFGNAFHAIPGVTP